MGVTESDRGRHLARGLAAAVLAAGAVVGIGDTATASAEPCASRPAAGSNLLTIPPTPEPALSARSFPSASGRTIPRK